jgi:hypothetical protein
MRNWINLFEGRKFESKTYPAQLPHTAENIAAAKAFVLRKWVERFRERYPYIVADDPSRIPTDLSNACKFTSVFARSIFGGRLRGNWAHQFVEMEDGTIIDLNFDAADVKEIIDDGRDPHEHDDLFWGNAEHRDSVRSVVPRVKDWIKEFMKEHGDA